MISLGSAQIPVARASFQRRATRHLFVVLYISA